MIKTNQAVPISNTAQRAPTRLPKRTDIGAATMSPLTLRGQPRATRNGDEAPPATPDRLVPGQQVWREFGISSMTGWRWTHDPELSFPLAVKIRRRNLRSRSLLETFEARFLRRAVEQHATPDVAQIRGKDTCFFRARNWRIM